MPGSILYTRLGEKLVFRLDDNSKNNTVISISPHETGINIVNSAEFPTYGLINSVAAIIGVIKLKTNRYVIVAEKVDVVGTLNGNTIYHVKEYGIVPVNATTKPHAEECQYFALLDAHLKNAELFFSYTYDLTNSAQRNEDHGNTGSWKTADSRFFWNHHATEELRDLASDMKGVDDFIVPMIYGYAKIVATAFNNTPLTFGLITRRSRHRAGTRYFRRGIDENGYVANFNETEQILFINNVVSGESQLFSFIQTRGSVPVYWAEINTLKYKPMLVLGENSSMDAFKKHFDEQKKFYGVNYLVNLVNQKGHELPVKESYETVVNATNDPQLKYIYFDFHHECSNMRWHRINLLVEQLKKIGWDKEDYFHKTLQNGVTKSIVKQQKSVLRTNCMDCLDRTNVAQSTFSSFVFQQQLEDSGLISQPNFWQFDQALLSKFQNLWADNADYVSSAYSGTRALKTDFTRTGKRTYMGAFQDLVNSISRYYRNNFIDGARQDNYDLFLGVFKPYGTVLESPFSDKRPMMIQMAPTVLYAALTVMVATIVFPKGSFLSSKNLGFFLGSSVILAVTLRFIFQNGMQYVSWPKLTDLGFVVAIQSHNKEQVFSGITYAPSPRFVSPNVLKRD
ncbi:HFL297Wp [Eremothecium sinecaudum]|uniref:HFL297Wp n=1 Tax=Eremothecium sinecaudum TaxID=45286 RepID=A0A0X8HU88_9SACH|nr:HFL297Wp [Eremothecium sinecaudum]AMD21559.1 HFL297Wp [Eremothecium sinecaudum]